MRALRVRNSKPCGRSAEAAGGALAQVTADEGDWERELERGTGAGVGVRFGAERDERWPLGGRVVLTLTIERDEGTPVTYRTQPPTWRVFVWS